MIKKIFLIVIVNLFLDTSKAFSIEKKERFFRYYQGLSKKIRKNLDNDEDISKICKLGIQLRKEKNTSSQQEYQENKKKAIACFEYIIDKYDVNSWSALDKKTLSIIQQAYYELSKCNRFRSIFPEDISIRVNYGTDLNELYSLGLAFKRGEAPQFQDNKIKSLAAAFQCFRRITKRRLKNLKKEELKLMSKAYHELGLLYYRYSHTQLAKNCFDLAINFGCEEDLTSLDWKGSYNRKQTKNNLEKTKDISRLYNLNCSLKKQKNKNDMCSALYYFSYIIDKYKNGEMNDTNLLMVGYSYYQVGKYEYIMGFNHSCLSKFMISKILGIEKASKYLEKKSTANPQIYLREYLSKATSSFDIYSMGMKFLEQQGPLFGDDQQKSFILSKQCFKHIIQQPIEESNTENTKWIGKSYGQLGKLYIKNKKVNKAIHCFEIASNLGLDKEKQKYIQKIIDLK